MSRKRRREARAAAPPVDVHQDRRAQGVKAVWCLGFLAGLLLSPRLWLSTRTYPLTPAADLWPGIPYPLDHVWYIALLGLLGAVLVVPRPRRLLVAFLVLGGLLALGDQSRWQPWAYQYFLIGIALAAYPWQDAEKNPEQAAASLNACRVIVAGTYFWSGVQKFNWSFLYEGFPWLLQPFVSPTETVQPWLAAGGLAAALVEMGLGIGLLVRPLRTAAIVGVCAMHFFILLCLGPLGHNFNRVVWPWNLVMPLFTLILFARSGPLGSAGMLRPHRAVHVMALLLLGVMPALSFVGLWNHYLSAALYSGNTLQGFVYVRASAAEQLPAQLRRGVVQGDVYVVNVMDWSMDELQVPDYPSLRVYRNIARLYLRQVPQPGEVILAIGEEPDIWTGERKWKNFAGKELE